MKDLPSQATAEMVNGLTEEERELIIRARVERIDKEFRQAFEFIRQYPKSVTFMGSARFTEGNKYYDKARVLGKKIVDELQYSVFTGGGGGIMEAANRGAFEAGGQSIGLNILLPNEQQKNQYTTASVEFSYFFSRKMALSFNAEAYIFFPGGYGTLNEFFEIVTLIQTEKIRKVPVFCVGEDFWKPLDVYMQTILLEKTGTISAPDIDLYRITNDENEIIAHIKKAPVYA
jgi:uncharacterized protein (TIGR00730 family)